MRVLIIGGTRNMGHFTALKLLANGHDVTVLNRGITRSDLPDDVQHLKADRTIPAQLEQALAGHQFDAVVDFVLYEDTEANVVIDLFQGRVEHYIFVSSGQVYLLRTGITRPYSESDYEGELMLEPPLNTYDHEEWLYGVQKRRAEDVFTRAHAERNFPFTSLRLPMVNGTRDPFNRLYSYILRLKDGAPILVPDIPNHPLRHVYTQDVVDAIIKILDSGVGKGKAYNLSQDETVTLEDFLRRLGKLIGIEPHLVTVERSLLEANGFLPDCSPFSDVWMSELTNDLSKDELGVSYTPLDTYLKTLVEHYEAHPPHNPLSYRRRNAERQFARSHIPKP